MRSEENGIGGEKTAVLIQGGNRTRLQDEKGRRGGAKLQLKKKKEKRKGGKKTRDYS